jgi:hypothetical protein
VLRFDEEVVVPRGGSILVEEKLCCFCWVGRRGAPFYRRQRAAHHTLILFLFNLVDQKDTARGINYLLKMRKRQSGRNTE